jgi:hypothetical protein
LVVLEALGATNSYMGCFVDQGVRDLPHWEFVPGGVSLTPAYCSNYCSGYIFYAMQDGSACMCGNSFGLYGFAPDTDCYMPCQNNAAVKCGGPWRNSLYRADFSTPGYLGCFKDSATRDLTGKLIKYNGELTAQACRSACSGYTYFAMQEANTCLCGNRLGLYGQAAESNCNMKCQGNGAEWCGGDMMNSAYLVGASSAQLTSLPSQYMGCYIDGGVRDLNAKLLAPPGGTPLTAEWCRDACQDFKYFGLQDGYACLCGNGYGNYGKAPETDCNMKCTLNGAEVCGAAWRNSLYRVAAPAQKPAPAPKPAPPKVIVIDDNNADHP